MNPHALIVESRDRRHLPPAARTSGTSPETPTPVVEQSATLSFEESLRCFCAQHARPVSDRDGLVEGALLADMRLEAKSVSASFPNIHITDGVLEFFAWAVTRRRMPMPSDVMNRFSVSRETAHRWIAGYKRSLGLS